MTSNTITPSASANRKSSKKTAAGGGARGRSTSAGKGGGTASRGRSTSRVHRRNPGRSVSTARSRGTRNGDAKSPKPTAAEKSAAKAKAKAEKAVLAEEKRAEKAKAQREALAAKLLEQENVEAKRLEALQAKKAELQEATKSWAKVAATGGAPVAKKAPVRPPQKAVQVHLPSASAKPAKKAKSSGGTSTQANACASRPTGSPTKKAGGSNKRVQVAQTPDSTPTKGGAPSATLAKQLVDLSQINSSPESILGDDDDDSHLQAKKLFNASSLNPEAAAWSSSKGKVAAAPAKVGLTQGMPRAPSAGMRKGSDVESVNSASSNDTPVDFFAKGGACEKSINWDKHVKEGKSTEEEREAARNRAHSPPPPVSQKAAAAAAARSADEDEADEDEAVPSKRAMANRKAHDAAKAKFQKEMAAFVSHSKPRSNNAQDLAAAMNADHPATSGDMDLEGEQLHTFQRDGDALDELEGKLGSTPDEDTARKLHAVGMDDLDDEEDEDDALLVEESEVESIPDGTTGDVANEAAAAEANDEPFDVAEEVETTADLDTTSSSAAAALARQLAEARKWKTSSPAATAATATSTPSSLGSSQDSSTGPTSTQGNLRASKYGSVPHGTIEPMPQTSEEDMQLFRLDPEHPRGAPGLAWFLTLGIDKKEGISRKDLVLGGLGSAVQILAAVIPGMQMWPCKQPSCYPPIKSHKHSEGFPLSAAIATQYYATKQQSLNFAPPKPATSGGQPASTPSTPYGQSREFDDDAEYNGPQRAYGTIVVSGEVNVFDAIEHLELDLEESGITLREKPHQSAESSNQVGIIGIPKGFCLKGLNYAISIHLKILEQKLVRQGKASAEMYDKPLAPMVMNFRFQKKGKSRNAEEKRLSLNNLPAFKENGCAVFIVEGSPADWARMVVLWNLFHKTGMCRKLLGRRTKLVPLAGGAAESTDRTTMQRLRRFQVVYSYSILLIVVPHVDNLYKDVEVRMAEEGATRPCKFTSLLREMMSITVAVEGVGEEVPVIHAAIPNMAGLRAGTITVSVKSQHKECLAVVEQWKKCMGGWWWHYWQQVRGYKISCCRSLMESFEVDHALLAQHATFDPETLRVSTPFEDEDDFLAEVEAEYALDGDDGDEDMGGGAGEAAVDGMDRVQARANLNSTLREDDDLSNASHEGASRRTDFSQSTGNSTDASMNTARMATQGRENALRNAHLVNANASLQQECEALRAQLQQQREQAESNGSSPPSTGHSFREPSQDEEMASPPGSGEEC